MRTEIVASQATESELGPYRDRWVPPKIIVHVNSSPDDGSRTELTSFEEPEQALYLAEQIESGLRLAGLERFMPLALPDPEGV